MGQQAVIDELDRLRRAGRPCRTLPGAGACFSLHSGPVCVPDTARFAVPVDIPSPSSTSLVPARGGSAETQRPWRRRGKSLAYRLSSCKRSLAGGALNSPYFLIPWPTHLCSAGPIMSWLSCSSLLCAQVATRTLAARLGHVRAMVLKRPGEWQLTPTTPRGARSGAARPCACPRPVPNPGVGKGLSPTPPYSYSHSITSLPT